MKGSRRTNSTDFKVALLAFACALGVSSAYADTCFDHLTGKDSNQFCVPKVLAKAFCDNTGTNPDILVAVESCLKQHPDFVAEACLATTVGRSPNSEENESNCSSGLTSPNVVSSPGPQEDKTN